MCVSSVFISSPNPFFLQLILVFIFRSLRAPLQMAFFLRLNPRLGTYPWVPPCLSGVWGWGVLKVQSGTKAHWVNPLPIFKKRYVNVFEKYWCIKTVVSIRGVARCTKAIIIKNNNLFCNIVHNVCLLFLVFELRFFDIV